MLHQRDSIDCKRRRGAALIIVMVCLLGMAMLAASLLRLASAQYRQTRSEHWRLQAEWLAAAGLDRAAARLDADPDWKGEDWLLPPETMGVSAAATISVQRADGSESPVLVVSAVVPSEGPRQARVTRRRLLPAHGASREVQP